MDEMERKKVEEKHGPIKRILHTSILLYEGWEMDNRAWIVEFEDGRVQAFSTNHGAICNFSQAEMEDFIEHAQYSIISLKYALALLPKQ